MKVCFETFGCRLNKAEALQQEADYLAAGWELTEKHSDADLFVVRGCSVTARAQRDCERLVEHLKRKYPAKPIRIEGCLEKPLLQRLRPGMQPHNVPHSPENTPVRTARAYLKAQDGCSGKCTFCIVPHFRGQSTSVPFQELADKTRRFIEAGYREIVLTGCNLTLYASKGKRLPELVSALADIAEGASARIRIGSLEPGPCAIETVHAMAGRHGICRFLHIPVQSGSDRVLGAMRRGYTVADVEELASSCRFRDCKHADEPGCAVQAAVKSGELAQARLDSYRAFGAELEGVRTRRDEARHMRGEKASDRRRKKKGR